MSERTTEGRKVAIESDAHTIGLYALGKCLNDCPAYTPLTAGRESGIEAVFRQLHTTASSTINTTSLHLLGAIGKADGTMDGERQLSKADAKQMLEVGRQPWHASYVGGHKDTIVYVATNFTGLKD
jgi:hypothetical protein